MQLESLRLTYRETTPSDLDFLLSIEQENENRKYICPSTGRQHLDFIKSSEFLHLMVIKKDNSRTVGFILLAGLHSSNRSLEFRRMVIRDKGIGFGKEDLKTIMTCCFEELKYHRLWLDVFDYNERAISLYKKSGFREEGFLRESVYKDGKYHNLIILSMLEEEYFTQ